MRGFTSLSEVDTLHTYIETSVTLYTVRHMS
jgi:hypothetical protein